MTSIKKNSLQLNKFVYKHFRILSLGHFSANNQPSHLKYKYGWIKAYVYLLLIHNSKIEFVIFDFLELSAVLHFIRRWRETPFDLNHNTAGEEKSEALSDECE